MADHLYLRGRWVPREVAEQALELFDSEVGLDRAIADAARDRGHGREETLSMEQVRDAGWTMGRGPQMTPEEREAGIKRAQELVAKYVPRDVSLVDELMAERRAEAARE